MELSEENLNGKIYNKWKILRFHEKRGYIKYFWCECLDCHEVKSKNVQSIIYGKSKSCGCISRRETAYNINKKYNEIRIEGDVAYIKIESPKECEMLCDVEDLEKLKNIYIRCFENDGITYAIGTLNYKCYKIHRFLLNVIDPKLHVDHKNHNGLDNRKRNLRICSPQQNSFNRNKNKNNTSGYRGVSWDNERQKWTANLRHGKKRYHKRFDTPEEAYEWYVEKNKEIFGEFSGYNDYENIKLDNINMED